MKHGDMVKQQHANANLTPKQIRANKCQRTKQRNQARKELRARVFQVNGQNMMLYVGSHLHCWPLPA